MTRQDWHPETPILTNHIAADGSRSVTVDQWPRQIEVDDVLLKTGDPFYLTQDGDMLTFTVANGRATYQIVEQDITQLVWLAERVSCMLQPAGRADAAQGEGVGQDG